MFILELLRYAARGMPASDVGLAHAVAAAQAHELQWALEAGLGPMLHRAASPLSNQLPSGLRDSLLAADLTARLLHSVKVETTCDLIDICADLGVIATLLKGISISDQYYPQPHLRPMTDVDILALGRPYADFETALLQRGYELGAIKMDPDSAHGVPLRDQARGVWVEVHTNLFPVYSPMRRNGMLAEPGQPDCWCPSAFHGRNVHRLLDEVQLLYIAAYWMRDLSMHSIHPTFLVPLLDAVILLTATRESFDWNRLVSSLGDDQATASLYVLLAFLAGHALIDVPAGVLKQLATHQSLIGPTERRTLGFLLDRYLLGGRPFTLFHSWHAWLNLLEPGPRFAKVLMLPWRIAFPPSYPHRYDWRAQAVRVAHLIRRL